ncbi:SIS domain-containing protein [Micromonospora okii]|uniref:SIS domain-containing protein n=1 Tax=Micromonospora okii TaxID=1182970 RepID=UPI001E2EE05E|nr:SIS domain-containing protein [Micromonospora okii]
MSPYTVAAMRAEVADLAADLAVLTGVLGTQLDELRCAAPAPRRIVLSGSGDSLYAAQAAEHALDRLPGTTCALRSTQRLLDYGVGGALPEPAGATLVVGISASGGSATLAAGLDRARAAGCRTLAIVGSADTPVGRSAQHTVATKLPKRPPAPGIRSYQASLLALLLLAEGWADAPPAPAAPGSGGLAALPELVERTVRRQAEPCRRLAEQLVRTAPVQVLGGGPALGTARYAAAKVIEGAGVPALGRDLEEWWHVERFATDADAPLIVLAPPGPSHGRAVRLCAQARDRGHLVAAVAEPDDEEIRQQAHLVLPLPGGCPPAWSPLVEHLFAAPLAADLAELLGRVPFHRR